jgi:hypothetical protein
LICAVSGPTADGHVRSMHERECEHLQAEQPRMRTDDAGVWTLECYRPWMERTGWPKTYQGVRRDMLLSLSYPPDAFQYAAPRVLGRDEDGAELISPRSHERKIANIVTAVDIMLDRCKETVNHTGRPILCWRRTVNPKPCFPKPFQLVRRESSEKKYRRLLKQFMALIFRAYCLDPEV